MSWDGSRRRDELPPDWAALRRKVKARAHGKCEHPGCKAFGTDCDHITDPHDHSLDNLQWLCRLHHKIKTQAEAAAARRQHQRKPEQHPGLV